MPSRKGYIHTHFHLQSVGISVPHSCAKVTYYQWWKRFPVWRMKKEISLFNLHTLVIREVELFFFFFFKSRIECTLGKILSCFQVFHALGKVLHLCQVLKHFVLTLFLVCSFLANVKGIFHHFLNKWLLL